MQEHKIGERFYHNGIWLEVVASHPSKMDSEACDLDRDACGGPSTMFCSSMRRSDNCPVYFKKVKQQGNISLKLSIPEDEVKRVSAVVAEAIASLRITQDISVEPTKPARKTETRVKKPEALLKALIEGGWKPTIDPEGLYFTGLLSFVPGMWRFCGKTPASHYTWHPSWLEEVEI